MWGGTGSIPGWGARIPHATRHGPKKPTCTTQRSLHFLIIQIPTKNSKKNWYQCSGDDSAFSVMRVRSLARRDRMMMRA